MSFSGDDGRAKAATGGGDRPMETFARRTNSGRYYSRDDLDTSLANRDLGAGRLSRNRDEHPSYHVQIPVTPDYQTLDAANSARVDEKYVSNRKDKVIESKVRHPQMAASKGSSCAVNGCHGKAVSDERGLPCECGFKICAECFGDNIVNNAGALCPGCKEPYKFTEINDLVGGGRDKPTLSRPLPPGGVPASRMERQMSITRPHKAMTDDWDHDRRLFETKGYGTAIRSKENEVDNDGGGGGGGADGQPAECTSKPWKPLTRKLDIPAAILSPYRESIQMEAARFGFGRSMPPAFKFIPTDDDLVAYYLLSRALGIQEPPFAHDVIDADTTSLPPPDLLAQHGLANSHQGFFLDVKGGGRRERVIKGGAGGLWRGQQRLCQTVTLLRPGGGELDIEYRRYDLTYKTVDEAEEEKSRKRKRKQGGAPSGWVMHEYQIISPPLQNTVLSHIHLTKGKIKEDHQQAEADQAQQLNDDPAEFDQQEQLFPDGSTYQELAGPSYYHHPANLMGGDNGFSDGSQANDASCYADNGCAIGEGLASDNTYYQRPLKMMCGRIGEGFSDCSQTDNASFYSDNGGGMGGSFVNLLCAGEGFVY